MPKVKTTDKQREALEFVEKSLKELEETKAILDGKLVQVEAVFELKSKAKKDSTVSKKIEVPMAEAKVKAFFSAPAEALASKVLKTCDANCIGLDEAEEELVKSFVKAKAKD